MYNDNGCYTTSIVYAWISQQHAKNTLTVVSYDNVCNHHGKCYNCTSNRFVNQLCYFKEESCDIWLLFSVFNLLMCELIYHVLLHVCMSRPLDIVIPYVNVILRVVMFTRAYNIVMTLWSSRSIPKIWL